MTFLAGMFSSVWTWIAAIFIDRFLIVLANAVKQYLAEQEEKKKAKALIKEKVAEIMHDPDPVNRAKRLDDLLNL